MQNIKIFIRSLFLLRPRIVSSLLFILILYAIGWALSKPLLLLNFEKENLSLIGTIFTFLIFLFFLPYWFDVRWNISRTWVFLGITKHKLLKNIFHFSQGILFSLVLITLILIPILKSNYIDITGEINSEVLKQTLIYIVVLGFAEELFFRGWLFEELNLQFGTKTALIVQALLYSFVHYVSDTTFWNIIGLRVGWFLLGILLSLIRRKDEGSLWKCIGTHGGLVGIWYFLNEVFIKISVDAPSYLVGPFTDNLSNPLGSLCGIGLLLILCIFFARKSKKPISQLLN
tara:strand:+ start:544 stop:1404 length:861 start_codon:yes stop_codon:yes gene_type:complete